MKSKHPLAITWGLVFFVLCGVAFWLHSTNVITFYQDGIVDQTYPDWLMRLSTIVLCLGFLALLGLLFLPLDRSRHAHPVPSAPAGRTASFHFTFLFSLASIHPQPMKGPRK